ncbi:MAG: sulfatase-like hydrolase/transferase [Tannerellaceae bacterium]|jgi:arylsulfatase A-like enzyme|nr:sulfatase-like hydrolase/transferase [Tannerellaceae bacterium]
MQKHLIWITGGLLTAPYLIAQTSKPNVIVIYTDDQGTLDMGAYGAPDLYTPNMDKLAAQGVRFSQFYAAPVSSVSRACLLTGQFAKRAGVINNVGTDGLPLAKETIAERLKANGYSTALIGKWHLGSAIENGPNVQGFDYFWGFRGGCVDNYSHFFYWNGPNMHDLWRNEREIFRPGRFFCEESMHEMKSFITDNKHKPFFVYWAVNMPHYPLQPSEKWLEYYAGLPNPRRMYAAFLSTFDDYLGELHGFLAAEGLDKNTILIFQSDNGHSMEVRTFGGGGYCGPYRAAKFSLFEGGIRVPAIISWPGKLPEGESREQLAMNVDWFPTIVELCGLSDENMDVDGQSLLPVILHNRETRHKELHFDYGKQWAVRSGDWKLIANPVDIKENDYRKVLDGEFFLTNIKTDHTEQSDLSSQYPEKVKELMMLRDHYLETVK